MPRINMLCVHIISHLTDTNINVGDIKEYLYLLSENGLG